MARQRDWRKLWSRRLSRRTLIASSARAGVGLAAIGLLGAAGTTQRRSSAEAGGDRVKPPEYGGVRRSPLAGTRSADPPSLDPFASADELTQIAASYHYSRLMPHYRRFNALPQDTCSFWGDVWRPRDAVARLPEIPDAMTFVFGLVDGVRWHELPPVAGRAVTLEDVQESLGYLLTQPEQSYWWAREFDSTEINEYDERHYLRINLSSENAWILNSVFGRDLWIAPREIIADGTIAQRAIGSGPWVFESHERFEELRWRRNPDWHPEVGRSLPFIDGAVATLNGDPHVLLEDLAAGRLDLCELPAALYSDLREAAPHLEDVRFSPNTEFGGFFFDHSQPPWDDPRVRIALSRALDRDRLLAETDPTGRGEWHSGLPALDYHGNRLDPRELHVFGEQYDGVDSGLNFQHDPAAAQRLLEAAGYPDGIEATLHGVQSPDPGMIELYRACVRSVGESGFRFRLLLHESTPSNPSLKRGRMLEDWLAAVAGHDDRRIGIGPLSRRTADPDEILRQVYGGDLHLGDQASAPYPPDGSPGADARLQQLIWTQRKQLDWEEQSETIREIQRYLATQMYVVPYPALPTMHVFQPWLEQWRRRSPWPEIHFQFCQPAYWIDEPEREEFIEQSDPVLFARSKEMRKTYTTWRAPPIWASTLYELLGDVRFIKIRSGLSWRGYSPHSDLPGRRDFLIKPDMGLWLGR